MRRFFASMMGQILAIIASASALTFVLFLMLWVVQRQHIPPTPPWPWPLAYRVESLVDLLRSLPAEQRGAALASIRSPLAEARLLVAPPVCDELSADTRDLEAVLAEHLGDRAGTVTVRRCSDASASANIQILIGLDGQTLALRAYQVDRPPRRFGFAFVGSLLFLCIAVSALSLWVVWLVIRPLRRLSERAESFGRELSITPIVEEGPLEIRHAAHAFNLMQERVSRSVQDRTRMLAAISHDLRTPLTRMRLQLDTAPPAPLHARLLREIGLMQTMLTSVLAYFGNGTAEPKELLDLSALLRALAEEYSESGASVRYAGPYGVIVRCRPNAMQRAFANLLENALQHASSVEIAVADEADGGVRIDVVDDGPGIPEAQLADVLEPFVRLDPVRSSRPGGFGLGLSIVREIVEEHGGQLSLHNRPEGGLVARIVLGG